MKQPTSRPVYVVFAGVNGAGKSTFYRSDLWRMADMPTSMARVNPDDIVRESGGDWRLASDNLAAGKEALRRIDSMLKRGISFNQETTLSGRTATKRIVQAHELGYRVHLYYIGVANVEVALERIRGRVESGGHDIDPSTVRRRFRTSLTAFSCSLDYCEQALVFDNTDSFSCLAMWSRGVLAWWGGRPSGSNWLADAMTDESLWRRC